MKIASLTAITVVLTAAALPALAQKSGQSVAVMYGTVTGVQAVTEKSNAGKGALLGGTIGYASSSGKSSSSKRRNTALGAAAGGLASNRAQGDRSAAEYTVETGSGMVKIISDQTEIHHGDCVIVENAGSNNANIRRVDATMCDPASADVVADLEDHFQEEAEECASAKRELAAAADDAAFDRAMRKVEILCND